MSLIQSPNDAWDALRVRQRLSDTTECRRAFYWGAKAALVELINEIEHWQGLAEYEQALERFKRERC